MLYDKLPIVFLTHLASEKQDSTNSQIAAYLLNHIEDVKQLGIKDIAKECHVAVSSISRFCKEIGLRDFNELKELLISTHLNYESSSESIYDYHQAIEKRLTMVERSLEINQIRQLCLEIKKYDKVAIFGLLKSSAVCLNLQTDLLMLGKKVYTSISYKQQIEYINQSNENDLIIIFSYTGSYFDYHDLRQLQNKLKKPKIWLIASQNKEEMSFVDRIIHFDSYQDQLGHPYQLQFIASIIASEYEKITLNK